MKGSRYLQFTSSLKFKILFPVLAITLAGYLFTSIYGYLSTRGILAENVRQVSQSKVEKLVTSVDGKLEKWTAQIEDLSRSDVPWNMDIQTLKQYVLKRREIYKDYELFFLADRKGQVLCTSGPRTNIAPMPYFQEALQGSLVVSDPVVFSTIVKPVVIIAAPIKDPRGAVVGVVGGAISITLISDVINAERFGRTGYAFMLNRNGLFIAYPRQNLPTLSALSTLKENLHKNTSASLAGIMERMVRGDSGTGFYEVAGETKLAAYASVKRTGWSIAVSIPTAEVNEGLAHIQSSSILVVLLAIPIAMLLIFVVGRLVVGPLEALAAFARGLGVHNLDQPLELPSTFLGRSGELADVVRALNDMRASLAQGIEHTLQLERSERQARETSMAKSIFVANMSHELRTPLNAILGFAQLMRQAPGRSPEDREHLDKIQRAGMHLLGLINDVLSITKIESGKLSLNPVPFRLRAMIQGLQEMIHLRAVERGLTLKVYITEDVPDEIEGDEGKLKQVLLNLLSNAVKFTPRGTVGLRVHQSGELTCFEVTDTGVGIAPGELEQLFRAFHQTMSGRGAQEGTGLGLHISQAMVRLMGSEITVESRPGEGSSFRFSLRLRRVQASQLPLSIPSDVVGPAEGQPALRMLVVDDREDNREVLTRQLEAWGFETLEADDGQSGLELWETHSPQVVWMDLGMPGMDGYEALRLIRTRERTHTLVFAVSASVLEVDPPSLREAGFDDFVPKPFRTDQIAQILEKHAGVRFRSTGPSPSGAAPGFGGIRDLPGDWRQRFRQAILLGDSEEARKLLAELGQDPRTQGLEELVQNYRFETLLSIIEG